MAQIVTHTKQRNILCRNFTLWQEQTQKLQLATKLYNIKLVQKWVDILQCSNLYIDLGHKTYEYNIRDSWMTMSWTFAKFVWKFNMAAITRYLTFRKIFYMNQIILYIETIQSKMVW